MSHTRGSISPLVLFSSLGADDNLPALRDGDFDDLVVRATDLDPIFDVVQRPFALDRGTLTMLPDGIFDTSQGLTYMGVRVRNTWDFDWTPAVGVKIGIAPASRAALASQGIQVIDGWSATEQQALQQEVAGGFVRVPTLRMGQERLVYFKVDVSRAGPSKPQVAFVAQRDPAWDPAYDQPSRQVRRQIFVSRSSYDPARRELVCEVPEGRVHMRLNRIVVDEAALRASLRAALAKPCKGPPPRPGQRPRQAAHRCRSGRAPA